MGSEQEHSAGSSACRCSMAAVCTMRMQSNRLGLAVIMLVVVVVVSSDTTIKADDHVGDCRSWCDHGNCDQQGHCVCDPCWAGDKCQQFNDKHGPRFLEGHTNIYLTPEQAERKNKVIYTFKAIDEDGRRECHRLGTKTCPCALIKYQLRDNLHASYFRLNETNGRLAIRQLPIGEDEESEGEYHLEVLAIPGNNIHPPAMQKLTIKVQRQLNRLKRQARKQTSGKSGRGDTSATTKTSSGETNPIAFGLRTVAGEVNSLKVGDSIHYRLEMALPRATINGLILEVFTRGSHSGDKNPPSLSLYNFTIPSKVPSISFAAPEPKYFLSNRSHNVFEKVFIDFGQVKNTGAERNPLTIYFSAILTRKSGTKAEQKHGVTIGAEYNRGSFAWVAQSQITTSSLSSNDDQIYSNVEFPKFPKKLALDSASLIQLEANVEFRSDQFRLVVSRAPAEYEPDNLVSFGKISITHFGRNYQAIPNNVRHYESSLSRPNSSLAFTTSTIDMGIIANIGEKGRSFSANPQNILSFAFPIYALNYEENVGKNVSFTVKFYLGSKNFMSKTLNMTITERQTLRLSTNLQTSKGNLTSRLVPKGGLTQLSVTSTFTEANAYVGYTLEVDVPFAGSQPLLVPCAARLDQLASGFNLPHLNEVLVKPVPGSDDHTYQFNFGRVQFMVQRNQSKEEDNLLHSIITLRIPFHQDVEVGATLNLQVRALSGSKTIKVAINESEVVVAETNVVEVEKNVVEDNDTSVEVGTEVTQTTSGLQVKVQKSVPWEPIILGGGMATRVEIELPSGTAYQKFEARLRRDQDNAAQFGQLSICQLRVLRIGPKLPCSCVQVEDINVNRTIYSRNDLNQTIDARLDFGAISVVNDPDAESWQRRLVINMATMLTGQSEISMPPLTMLFELSADGQSLWTERLNYTIADREVLPDAARNAQPKVDVHLLDRSITPGFTTNIRIDVVIPSSTITPLLIEVHAGDRELSICGLWIQSVGDNMPCLDKAHKAHYETEAGIARLEFDAITNFGSPLRISTEAESLANTLELRAMVRVSEKAKVNKTIAVHVAYGERKVRIERDIFLPLHLSTNALNMFKDPKSIVLTDSAATRGLIYPGVPKLVYYEIELDANSQTPISLLLEGANDFRVCSAAFVHVGRNYPCYSTQALKLSDGRIELGMLCNTYLHHADQDNVVRLAVALRPNTRIVSQHILMSSFAYIGSTPFNNRLELNFSLSEDFESQTLAALSEGKGATVLADEKENIAVKVRQATWITFWVRLPIGTVGRLTVTARGEADETRAVVVVRDMRLVSGGGNIPCPLEGVERKLKLIRNATVPTSQTNMIQADLGYFANFGLGARRGGGGSRNETERIQDDSLRVDVLAELSDHPAVIDGGVYELMLQAHYGSETNASQPVVREGKAKLTPVFEGEPNPQIDVTIKMKRRNQLDVLDRGDKLTLTAVLRHQEESNAEPLNVALRLFTPDFVKVISIDGASTKERPTLTNETEGIADIVFPWILFSDEILVNFTIQMDPENRRGFGHPETTLITAYRALCEHARLTDNAAAQPCSPLKHIRYNGKSTECEQELGMTSGEIGDAQISASSAVSIDFAPTFARPNSDRYWAPAMFDTSHQQQQQHYLQFDFRRRTRVVRLTFKSIKGLKRVARFHLCSSDTGVDFECATKSTVAIQWERNTGLGQAKIAKPREARFFRFVIDEVEATSTGGKRGRKKEQQGAVSGGYVAVRLELFGCYLEDVVDDKQPVPVAQTHFTDDPRVKNRHIAVDPYTNVLFFCDIRTPAPGTSDCLPAEQRVSEQICYHSTTGGEHWDVIGRSIDSIEGFELASGKFYAIDYARPAFFSSGNGLSWQPVTYEEFNTTVRHSKFQRKIVIPQLTRDDIRKLDIKLGGWRVAYEGLYFEDNRTPKALWQGCCASHP